MSIEIDPIIDEPGIIVKSETKSLVLADIHLGIEWGLYRSGITIPSRMEHILKRIWGSMHEHSPDRIILLGDVKHNVPQISWQERDEIPYFLGSLAEHAHVDIFPGNHDGGIEYLLPEAGDVTVHPVRGAIIEDVAYLHGHTWPDPKLLSANFIITAHNHPTIRFTDSLGYAMVEHSWIRTRLNIDIFQKHFSSLELNKESKNWNNPELIIVPSFNELCGGVAFNESLHDDLLGPMFSSGGVDIDKAEVYLLDGTQLGVLKNIRKMEDSRTRPKRDKKNGARNKNGKGVKK